MRYFFIISFAYSFFLGCSTKADQNDRFARLFSGDATIIDLTHPLSTKSPYWPSPDGNPFKHDILIAHPSGTISMGEYKAPEHYGTHIDAPVHSVDGQTPVDQLEVTDLFGPAIVVDVAEKAKSDSDYLLSRADLEEWERQHGNIPDGAIVLMYSGWSKKWMDYEAYKNQDEEEQMHFPGFSEEAAFFLVNERNINGVGIDNFSIDYGLSTDFAVHKILNGAGKYQLENVANVHLLPATGAYLIVAPIKIEGGSGGQVRIFAVVP